MRFSSSLLIIRRSKVGDSICTMMKPYFKGKTARCKKPCTLEISYKGKSTTGALLIAVDNNIVWYKLLEAANDVCAVFFNRRKVFNGECLTNCLWINYS